MFFIIHNPPRSPLPPCTPPPSSPQNNEHMSETKDGLNEEEACTAVAAFTGMLFSASRSFLGYFFRQTDSTVGGFCLPQFLLFHLSLHSSRMQPRNSEDDNKSIDVQWHTRPSPLQVQSIALLRWRFLREERVKRQKFNFYHVALG